MCSRCPRTSLKRWSTASKRWSTASKRWSTASKRWSMAVKRRSMDTKRWSMAAKRSSIASNFRPKKATSSAYSSLPMTSLRLQFNVRGARFTVQRRHGQRRRRCVKAGVEVHRSASNVSRMSQAAVHAFWVRFDPSQDCRKDRVEVIEFARTDLVQLGLRDFVVEMDKPISITGEVSENGPVPIVQHAGLSQRPRPVLVFCHGPPEALCQDMTAQIEQSFQCS